MKKVSNYSIRTAIGLIVTAVLILNLGQGTTKGIQTIEKNEINLSLSSLIPHDSISITSDEDFSVFSGTGTYEDPHIIEGYNITTTSFRGIYITGTTKHFIVRNCYVEATYFGIDINDVAYGTATVINNTCNNNNDKGIVLSSSGSSTVANNTCNNNWDGIKLTSSDSSTVANNTCSNNVRGIYLEDSGSATLVNNTFTDCGLRISEFTLSAYLSYTVENNWVNGKKLGYYTNLDSTTIAEKVYGQLILVNCTNVTVRDQILNNATVALFLCHCTYSSIINNTCNNNQYGIYLYFAVNSTVANNTCNNNYAGIKFEDSDSSTAVNNTCSFNIFEGINLQYSGNATVANNTCSNNDGRGIMLHSSGISTVANNICSNNGKYGIYLPSSAFCVVTCNLLQENEEYGVYLRSDSENNLIHHNNFIDNNIGGTSQAFDYGFDFETTNTWYDTETLEGNFWFDWSGIGSYSIDSAARAFDLYPLDEPVDIDPPLIVNIIHSPSTPTELDTISINATVTDASGVQSVTLHYRVNCGNWIEVCMTLISGSTYSVTVGSFAVSDTIEYYITAVDNSINHNEATEDNSGLYYSFTVAEGIPEFQTHSPLLSLSIILLFLGFSLVLLKRRKK